MMEKKCPNCGKEVKPRNNKGQQRRFCCYTCSYEYNRNRYKKDGRYKKNPIVTSYGDFELKLTNHKKR